MHLTKKEVQQTVFDFLLKNPQTSTGAIHKYIETVLNERGLAGEVTTGNQYMRVTSHIPVSAQDAMLVNEVIYDLISERVLTPGVDASNLELPFISVTSTERLKSLIE